MEVRTENQILEKLEAARLEDEKNRRTRFESLNFSVVSDPYQQSALNTWIQRQFKTIRQRFRLLIN